MESSTYSVCVSFTRSGINNRVPWVFVIYPTNAKQGIRLRVKAVNEENKPVDMSAQFDHAHPKHTFLTRENAYVENFRCWGRVVILKDLAKGEAGNYQGIIEAQNLSEMVNGFRDCQKWMVETFAAMGFSDDFVKLWDGLKAKDVWEIEKAVNEAEVLGLKFLPGPSYMPKERAIIMGIGGPDEDQIAKNERERMNAHPVSIHARFSVQRAREHAMGAELVRSNPNSAVIDDAVQALSDQMSADAEDFQSLIKF